MKLVFGSFLDNVRNVLTSQSIIFDAASPRIFWTDMADEDGLEEKKHMESRLGSQRIDTNSFVGDSMKTSEKRKLFRKERECYRFMNVKKMKVFFFF